MFYFPQSVIYEEFHGHNERDDGESDGINEDLDSEQQQQHQQMHPDDQQSSNIFNISASFIAEPPQHPQHQPNNNHHMNNPVPQQQPQENENEINLGNPNDSNPNHNHNESQDSVIEYAHANEPMYQMNRNHLGIALILNNKWLSILIDPLQLIGMFLLGGLSEASSLRYIYLFLCLSVAISTATHVCSRSVSSKNSVSSTQVSHSQLHLQSRNSIAYLIAFALLLFQLVKGIIATAHENGSDAPNPSVLPIAESVMVKWQPFLFLMFFAERACMVAIILFRRTPSAMRRLSYYSFVAWPMYKKEIDENIECNFDIANEIQRCFANDTVQRYLRFMLYTYEFILILQLIAYSCSQSANHNLYQRYSYFFGALYYLNIANSVALSYYAATNHLPISPVVLITRFNCFIFLYAVSYTMFIGLQIASAFTQPQYTSYYFLQLEPIFALYIVCIAIRIFLKRFTAKSLYKECQKIQHLREEHLHQQQQQQPNNQNQQNESHSNLNDDFDEGLEPRSQQNQANHNAPPEQAAAAGAGGPQPFVEMNARIDFMMRNSADKLEQQKSLIVNYEGLSLTIVLALMLFVYMFADDADIYMRNSLACNLYYLLSITAFMFYILASKKATLAYERLRWYPDGIAQYWIIPAQYYLNRLGWAFVCLEVALLLYLYTVIDFADAQFIRAEYLFMIFFAFSTFIVFRTIHSFRKNT